MHLGVEDNDVDEHNIGVQFPSSFYATSSKATVQTQEHTSPIKWNTKQIFFSTTASQQISGEKSESK